MGQKAQRVDDAPVIMDGDDEAVIITAHIEDHHPMMALHGHGICR